MLFRSPSLFKMPISRCGSAPLFILPISRCSSAPASFIVWFSLRQRRCFLKRSSPVAAAPRFLYCPFLFAAAHSLFKMPISQCGSAPLFILPISLCGSAPASFIDRFSLRQRPCFLYCPFLVAAAPLRFKMPISRCGSAPLFILPISRCGSALASFIVWFSLRQRPRFLYCPFLVAAAPPHLLLTDSVAASCFLYCPFLVAAAPSLFKKPISRCGNVRSEETRLNSSHVKRSRMPSSA